MNLSAERENLLAAETRGTSPQAHNLFILRGRRCVRQRHHRSSNEARMHSYKRIHSFSFTTKLNVITAACLGWRWTKRNLEMFNDFLTMKSDSKELNFNFSTHELRVVLDHKGHIKAFWGQERIEALFTSQWVATLE
ncbi:hypothetical protein MHYP_G00159690 [Metynnis hypsauchen]